LGGTGASAISSSCQSGAVHTSARLGSASGESDAERGDRVKRWCIIRLRAAPDYADAMTVLIGVLLMLF